MTTRTKKTVTFAEENTTKKNEKTIADRITDVNIAADVLVNFLERTVEDALTTTGKHLRTRQRTSPQSPINQTYVQQKVYAALQQLTHPSVPSAQSVNDLLQYYNRRMRWNVHHVFMEAAKEDNQLIRFAAKVLIIIGLESFIAFSQCMNECYKVIEYDETEDHIRVLPYGKQNSELKDACLTAHDRIERALKMDDIRPFDYLLRQASKNKCSLLKKPNIMTRSVRRGGDAVVHTGPRGGKYILVKGKKVYV